MTTDASILRSLPQATKEVDAVLLDIKNFGYGMLANAVDSLRLEELRNRLRPIAAMQRDSGQYWSSSGNQKVFALLNHGDVFSDLVGQPEILKVVRGVLGADVLLSSSVAHITRPGNRGQDMHGDQQYVPEPWLYPATVNVIIAVDRFTGDNGATRVVPRSHLIGARPPTTVDYAISLEADAGTAIFVDGRLWHASGQNTSAGERIAILNYYCLPWMRQQENFFRSLPPEQQVALSPTLRNLLGFDVWFGLGGVNGLPASWVTRPVRSGSIDNSSTISPPASMKVPPADLLPS